MSGLIYLAAALCSMRAFFTWPGSSRGVRPDLPFEPFRFSITYLMALFGASSRPHCRLLYVKVAIAQRYIFMPEQYPNGGRVGRSDSVTLTSISRLLSNFVVRVLMVTLVSSAESAHAKSFSFTADGGYRGATLFWPQAPLGRPCGPIVNEKSATFPPAIASCAGAGQTGVHLRAKCC